MSLLDNLLENKGALRRAAFCAAIAVGLTLSGCQVRPLYGTSTGELGSTPSSVAGELAAIDVDEISARFANDEGARVLYNELIYHFERGAAVPPKKYSLKVLMDVNNAEVGVERFADVPSAYTTTMNSTFILSDMETEETLMTGRTFKSASYDFSNQRFCQSARLPGRAGTGGQGRRR
ncbi:hypothetical protein QW131_23560 [Roseibium salinum]|nr:hypothetical protein [Roseibium salinum]